LVSYFSDARIKMAIETLLNIYIDRSIESCESVVKEIVLHERTALPFENENGCLVTSAPLDLFKLLNEGLDAALNQCKVKAIVVKMGHFGRVMLDSYVKGVSTLMDEATLTN
jgi:hypothetical protein